MPELNFELTGEIDHTTNLHYPVNLVVKIDNIVIQKLDFDKDDFAPSTIDDFGFEYGDFKFDGYGGFRILSSSMGKNPLSFFWIWDKNENHFIRYSDLKIIGHLTFDYANKLITVSSTGRYPMNLVNPTTKKEPFLLRIWFFFS